MLSMYKWKKNAVFMTLGVIPVIVFLMMFFLTAVKYYDFQGVQFTYLDLFWVMLSLTVAIVAAIILMIMGNRLLRHAFTSMLEGKGLLAFILDSTGVIGSFNVQVNAPKMRGVSPQGNTPMFDDIYDVDLLQRLMVPKDVKMGQAVTFEKDENDNIKFGDTVDVLVLPPAEEKYDNLFMFENRPVFIYNKVMGKFLSRDALAKYEKDLEIKHNALNILRKVQETDVSFKNFGRYIGENIKPLKKGLFSSPIIKYIILAAIIGLVMLILFMFVPGILQAGSRIM